MAEQQIIASGKVSATGAGWVSVNFTDASGNYVVVPSPIVVGMVESKSGTMKKTTYGAPTIDIKKITPSTPKLELADITWFKPPVPGEVESATKADKPKKEDYKQRMAVKSQETITQFIDNIVPWKDWPVVGWLGDRLKDMCGKLVYYEGWVVAWVIDEEILPKIYDWIVSMHNIGADANLKKAKKYVDQEIAKFKDAIDSTIADNMTSISNAEAKLASEVQAKMSDMNTKFANHLNDVLQPAIQKLNSDTSNAVTQAIVNLYESIGLPSPKNGSTVPLIQPAQITNITNSGFSFWSYGAGSILHYVAISSAPVKVIEGGEIEKDISWFPFPLPDISKLPPLPIFK